MPLWDKVKQELDRAGQVAQDAIDEGRIRLEAQRARRMADRAARVLGYAVYRARKAGAPLDEAELARHADAVGRHEAESDRLEAQVRAIQERWRAAGGRRPGAGAGTPGAAGGEPMGRHDPIEPTPAPPASATTAPSPETASAAATVEATTEPTIEFDPWRPNNGPGTGTI
jgi:hypothetical protein